MDMFKEEKEDSLDPWEVLSELLPRENWPALASGPILTTCPDMFGFFLVLSIASSMIDKL